MVISLCGISYAQEKVLATVGSEKITVADFKDRLEELPAQFRGYYSSEQGKAKFLDQLVQERLFYLKAMEQGVEKDQLVQEEIDRARKNIIVSFYVSRALKNITVSDKEIEDYYSAHPEKYLSPERVRASHVLVDTPEKAQEILARLKKGASMDELAKTESQDPSGKDSADIGWFEKGQMVKPFEEAAFALKVGEIGQPVKTQYGYHIIKVTGREPAKQKDLAQVKAAIREQLLREVQNKKLDAIVAELKGKTSVSIDASGLQSF